jgi:hypothetical protein
MSTYVWYGETYIQFHDPYINYEFSVSYGLIVNAILTGGEPLLFALVSALFVVMTITAF